MERLRKLSWDKTDGMHLIWSTTYQHITYIYNPFFFNNEESDHNESMGVDNMRTSIHQECINSLRWPD
jgi:hypothetical protein